jgi:predicted nucleic acid-binding protein
MSVRAFVDTNILVYAHDVSAGPKHVRARTLVEELWTSGRGVLSTQVLQELCINVRRKAKHPLSLKETRRLLDDYLTWEIVVNDTSSVVQALGFEERYRVSFWDALILQAAEAAGVDVLFSEDLSAGQKYGSFRVENPFARAAPAGKD